MENTTDHIHIALESNLAPICKPADNRLRNVRAIPSTDERVWMIATNGDILAAILANGKLDAPVSIPGELCKVTKTKSALLVPQNGNGRWEEIRRGLVATVDQDTAYPNITQVLPQKSTTVKRITLNLDAGLLKKLADALSFDGKVAMEIEVEAETATTGNVVRSPILVTPVNGDSKFGLIMPCVVNNPRASDYSALSSRFQKDWSTTGS